MKLQVRLAAMTWWILRPWVKRSNLVTAGTFTMVNDSVLVTGKTYPDPKRTGLFVETTKGECLDDTSS